MTTPDRLTDQWFAKRGWTPFDFQREAWSAYADHRNGLIHAPTGMGKTYAAWLGPVQEWLAETNEGKSYTDKKPVPLRVLWITPLRALAGSIVSSLQQPITELSLPWQVESRTGDSTSGIKRKQRDRLPTALVTTPESLSLLLSYSDAREKLETLRCVVVDEWHELLGTKRGIQIELALARLRRFCPQLRTWGLSATLGNLTQARDVLLGLHPQNSVLIQGHVPKQISIQALIPNHIDRFPWSGHLGLKLLKDVMPSIERAHTTLLFTNTRSQAELWYQALLAEKPDWENQIALHHGSLDRDVRSEVEQKLAAGDYRCVVCTSSLDLGVDFTPVDQVIQVGSPKGIARLLQRAGRSGHRPGADSAVLCVPTHAFELVEIAAARHAAAANDLESRVPLEKPLDVLLQHLVTVALGGGFEPADLLAEVRSTYAYRHLSEVEWAWCLDFVTGGGSVLKNYPQYHRVTDVNGRRVVTQNLVARMHRMSVGTITSDSSMHVKYLTGGFLGSVEESFIAKLRPGSKFLFAGRALELVRTRDMVAWVRRSSSSAGVVPQWLGGKMPLSSELSLWVRKMLDDCRRGDISDPELEALVPIMELQRRWSHLPAPSQMLVEIIRWRGNTGIFIYPFEGRFVHEGLSALVAYRLSRRRPVTYTLSFNDYGFALLSRSADIPSMDELRAAFSLENLLPDILSCINSTEMSRRRFREIARVSGLVFQGYPGRSKTVRQVQSSSGLIYDVFVRYDPENLLVDQSRKEVLEQQLEASRLQRALEGLAGREFLISSLKRLTPLAFPIWAQWSQQQLSSEPWSERLRRMVIDLETAADDEVSTPVTAR